MGTSLKRCGFLLPTSHNLICVRIRSWQRMCIQNTVPVPCLYEYIVQLISSVISRALPCTPSPFFMFEPRVCHHHSVYFDVHPVQNLLLCTKFDENRMIFHRDIMATYRFSKWRPSAILELFYHHTSPPTKSLLLDAAACQILCQSNAQI